MWPSEEQEEPSEGLINNKTINEPPHTHRAMLFDLHALMCPGMTRWSCTNDFPGKARTKDRDCRAVGAFKAVPVDRLAGSLQHVLDVRSAHVVGFCALP